MSVERVLEILKSRGIETSGESIYSISENDECFAVCIDDNQMIIKKKI